MALAAIISVQAQELLPYQNENLPIEQRVDDAQGKMPYLLCAEQVYQPGMSEIGHSGNIHERRTSRRSHGNKLE